MAGAGWTASLRRLRSWRKLLPSTGVLRAESDIEAVLVGESYEVNDLLYKLKEGDAIMAKIFLFVLMTALLAGCATTYTYNGQQYQSSNAAIQAARTDIRGKVIAIPKLSKPLALSAIVFVPSLEWCRQTVKTHGHPSEKIVNYVQTVEYYGYYGMAQALQQRGVFKTTVIDEFAQRQPYAHPDYQYLIWLKLNGTNTAIWMIAPGGKPSDAQQLPISPLDSASDRASDFVQSVEKYIRNAESTNHANDLK